MTLSTDVGVALVLRPVGGRGTRCASSSSIRGKGFRSFSSSSATVSGRLSGPWDWPEFQWKRSLCRPSAAGPFSLLLRNRDRAFEKGPIGARLSMNQLGRFDGDEGRQVRRNALW